MTIAYTWQFDSLDETTMKHLKDYCQALRDVIYQVGFHWTVTYPTQPE